MRPIEQIAIKTTDISKKVIGLGTLHVFGQSENDTLSQHSPWVEDTVVAEHLFVHADYLNTIVGDSFKVKLAFNYDLIPGRELELIELVRGETVQINGRRAWTGRHQPCLSHFGYHIPDSGVLLMDELRWWVKEQQCPCVQVSGTIAHLNTSRRYLYAFIDTVDLLGAYTKVIARQSPSSPISHDDYKRLFTNVNAS